MTRKLQNALALLCVQRILSCGRDADWSNCSPAKSPPANLGLFKGYLSRQPLSLQPFAFVLFGLVVEWQAILFAIATSETIELL
jgi:hypothetical protein